MLGNSSHNQVTAGALHWRQWRIATGPAEALLVFAGVAMFVLYVAMDVVASLAYEGYNYTDQTISELSAIGAPTRGFWLAGSVFYQILAFAFAFGVLRIAGERRRVRLVGWLLLATALVGLLWWIAPMHQREVLAADGGTWQDTMHLVVGGVNSVLFFAAIGIGAFALGGRFRWYSLATIVALLVFGGLMGTQTADVGENEPTPWLGILERVAIEGAMLWQAVFAVVLLYQTRSATDPPRLGEGATQSRATGGRTSR